MRAKDIALLVAVALVAGAIVYVDGTGALGDLGLLWLGIGAAIYFAPTMLALHRQHRQVLPILALNVLLGWTFIGWAAAIVWSLMAQPVRPQPAHE